MNILYIADPNSIHDLKWIRFFSEQSNFRCFLIARKHHVTSSNKTTQELKKLNIDFLGTIEDYSLKQFNRTKKTARFITKTIQEQHIDILHILYAEPNALWALYKKQFDTPIVLTTRGTDVLKTIPSFFTKSSLLSLLVARLYTRAFAKIDHICSTSEKQITSITDLLKVALDKCHVIRTGVDLNDSNKQYPKPIESRFVFFPRAMRPIYDHEIALEAIHLLPESITSTYQFIFVGKDGTDRDYVSKFKQLVAKHSCKNNIQFLDNMSQESIFQYYQHSALVIMTPKSDGTPVSAIETMLSKSPLVLPDIGYDASIFANVPKYMPGNSTDLSVQILDGLETNSDLIDKNYVAAATHADRQKEMKKLQQIYLSLTS